MTHECVPLVFPPWKTERLHGFTAQTPGLAGIQDTQFQGISELRACIKASLSLEIWGGNQLGVLPWSSIQYLQWISMGDICWICGWIDGSHLSGYIIFIHSPDMLGHKSRKIHLRFTIIYPVRSLVARSWNSHLALPGHSWPPGTSPARRVRSFAPGLAQTLGSRPLGGHLEEAPIYNQWWFTNPMISC